MASQKTPVGLTSSQGWEMGIRRTFPISIHQAWELLFTPPILGVWLDNNANIAFQKGDSYTTSNGIHITVTAVTTTKVIRMKWQRENEPTASILQIRVIPVKEKTTVSFHQEHLQNEADRERMKAYWENVLDKISEQI
ncbi:MAG: SRPBCC domain-containing protein [Chitinophaga sp.]|uniref:SRPBCC domain-containing protein n=1 Tax=Chitinophaga sp. TaxID=1869181 RepID=UPI001B20EDC3|nr:SRPBCC domain-containing protein [Chitinophaga sp.]MBO9730630.1 SRPBCC domain-containing protein [Chitinophaga sp.]